MRREVPSLTKEGTLRFTTIHSEFLDLRSSEVEAIAIGPIERKVSAILVVSMNAVNESRAAAIADLLFLCAGDAMHEFGNGDSRHCDFDFTEALLDSIEEFFDRLMFALRLDDEAGIED